MIEVSLYNPDITPIWSLLGTNIMLSFEQPGPIKIDESKLTDEQSLELNRSITSRVLTVHGEKVKDVKPDAQQLIKERELEKVESLRTILKMKLKDAKEKIKTLPINDLRLIFVEEKMGKSRKTVLAAIEKVLLKHQQDVLNELAGGTSEELDPQERLKDLQKTLGKAEFVQNIGEIEESEMEEITIKIGVDKND